MREIIILKRCLVVLREPLVFYDSKMSLSPSYPGKAVHIDTQSFQKDEHGMPCGKGGPNSQSLVEKSKQVTEGLILLQQENEDLKMEVEVLKQTNNDSLR